MDGVRNRFDINKHTLRVAGRKSREKKVFDRSSDRLECEV